jgi:HSP20 family protein
MSQLNTEIAPSKQSENTGTADRSGLARTAKTDYLDLRNNRYVLDRYPFGFLTPMYSLFNELDRRFFEPYDQQNIFFDYSKNNKSKFNIHEDETSFTYEIEMPGMDKENILIEEKDGYLNVSGKKSLKKEENKDGYHYIGTSYGSFSRSFKLAKNTDRESIRASYDNGMLNVVVPKTSAQVVETKRININ